MAGPLFLALLTGGPRGGQRVTVAADDDGEPPEMIEVPDQAGVPMPAATTTGPVLETSRYRLSRDDHRDARVYIHLPADE